MPRKLLNQIGNNCIALTYSAIIMHFNHVRLEIQKAGCKANRNSSSIIKISGQSPRLVQNSEYFHSFIYWNNLDQKSIDRFVYKTFYIDL